MTLLIEHKADIEAQSEIGTCLHKAVHTENEQLVRYLLNFKANINAQNEQNFTPLHLAIRESRENMTMLLLAYNPDVTCSDEALRDDLRHDPLFQRALCTGDPQLITTLLERKANIEALNNNRDTPLHRITDVREFNVFRRQGRSAITQLLLDNGACVNARNKFQETPLHHAAKLGKTGKIVRMLLDAKALPNERDYKDRTPLDRAKEHEQHAIIDILQARLAQAELDPNEDGPSMLGEHNESASDAEEAPSMSDESDQDDGLERKTHE